MLCPKCGSEISENAKFCTKCGNKVEQPVVVAPQQSNLSGHNISAIWPEWQIEGKPLGRGSFGVVYKAVRRDHNVESFAAIKVISIPADPSEVDSLRSEGLDMNATRTYLQGIVNDFVSEIQLMESLKGVQNIVSVEDYKVVEKTDEIGWDIYIRMELLTSFNTYICDKKLTEEEVIKLGCDICTALEICSKRNIIHRDIKPENIFINDFGYFKLGDFGIARKMENMTGGLSQKGTFNYMAPEVANSSDYDARVDTYSLGIVLYRLLNGNRLPFLDTEKQLLNPNERKNAVDRRLRGEALPAPCDASAEMANLILRACAFNPEERFASATEMKKALMDVANGTYRPVAIGNPDKTTSVRKAARNPEQTVSVRKAPAASMEEFGQTVDTFGTTPKKSKLPKVIVAAVVAVALVVGGIFAASYFSTQKKIEAILDDAEIFASDEKYADAVVKIEEGLAEYSDSEKLQDKLTEYQKALTDQKIAEVLADAGALAAEEKYKEARDAIQAGLQYHPASLALNDKLAEYSDAYEKQQITAIIAEAEVLAAAEDYESALSKVNDGLVGYPESEALQQKVEEYSTSLKAQVKENTLAEAAILAEAGDYIAAIELIENAQKTQGDDSDLQAALNTYKTAYKADTIESADNLAANGDYTGAVGVINSAGKIIGHDDDFDSKLTEYENSYVNKSIATADKLLEDRDNNKAKQVIEDAMDLFPGNADLIAKAAEIESLKPISITKLDPINGGLNWNAGNPVDPFGNDYSSACNFAVVELFTNFEKSVEYRSYKKYGTITGSIAPYKDIEQGGLACVKIYADDVLIYTSPSVTRKTDAFTFSVDIADAEYVTIEVCGLANWTDCHVLLSNVQLWPKA